MTEPAEVFAAPFEAGFLFASLATFLIKQFPFFGDYQSPDID